MSLPSKRGEPLVTICMVCYPGVRRIAGVTLSHGFCALHGLGELVKHGDASALEIAEYIFRRYLPFIAVLALALAAYLTRR